MQNLPAAPEDAAPSVGSGIVDGKFPDASTLSCVSNYRFPFSVDRKAKAACAFTENGKRAFREVEWKKVPATVIPAKAGIHRGQWIRAFARMIMVCTCLLIPLEAINQSADYHYPKGC